MMTLGCHSNEFLQKVTPDTGYRFAKNIEAALTRDYPTLSEVDMTYGDGTSDNWLVVQLADVAMFTGTRRFDKYQQTATARLITSQYFYLKITELLVFFQWFKSGKYGRFFGNVDPMVVTCALRDFVVERNERLAIYEQEQRKAKEEEERRENPPISYEEWKRIKAEREKNAPKAT